MVAKRVADEIKELWQSLPAAAQFTIGGSVLGAVGYLFHQSGIGRLMPPGTSFRPPYPRHDDWHQRDRAGHRQPVHHASHHGHEHRYRSGRHER